MPSVIVIGGGVAGLTAAHELADRGFTVEIYESRPAWGGKARSQPVVGSGTGGRRDLPGEHGFRFYPRFYRHVIDTMRRIPLAGGGSTEDHLRATTESAIALVDNATWFRFYRRALLKPFDILEAIELFFQELDFDEADVALFAAKILQFLTSSDARRLGEYEKKSWWQFLEGDLYSYRFQGQLRAVPRTMVAMDPKRGSARTIGIVSMQLIFDYARTAVNNDRTMGGPTTELWIEPWTTHLKSLGVTLHDSTPIDSFELTGNAITGLRLANGASVRADYYVLATPIDIAARLITPQMGALDPMLERLRTTNIDELVSWMTGIQFFLYEDVPLVRGHTFYPDSPWALTSISQPQFWRDLGLFRKRYGNGEIGGLISVDISEWNTPGVYVTKPAKQCTKEEIEKEVWAQLKAALNAPEPGGEILADALLHSSHLDDDLDYSAGVPPKNNSRLLVHPPGSWAIRPDAGSEIRNLVLAGDYVRTYTNLASMEGANEAARRAANVILERSGSNATKADVWPLREPEAFDPWKRLDERLYHMGQKHLFELMGIRKAAQAADILRRFAAFTGISKIDDLLDEVRATTIIQGLLHRLGIGD